jgi:leader peptidase (prepilin peptidase)/N-methyltransferase
MGTVFGSFFTLAVYRIPLDLDITHERSFCPKCNHRLEFIDLIPIFSYLSLKGKCRYCGEPVRIRYLLLEVLSGFVFLLGYLSFKMNFPYFTVEKIVAFVFFVCFYITNAIILGIDKDSRTIEKRVLLFGILTEFAYMVYLYVSSGADMYRYGIYLGIMLILFLIDTCFVKKKFKSLYVLQVLMFYTYELMYLGLELFICTFVLSLVYIFIYYIYRKVKFNLKDRPYILEKQVNTKVPWGFCIAISSIIMAIINNFIVL